MPLGFVFVLVSIEYHLSHKTLIEKLVSVLKKPDWCISKCRTITNKYII